MASEQQSAWVAENLGVAVDGHAAGTQAAMPIKDAISAFRDAMEEVDDQIGDLQHVLLASGDDELKSIAQFGMSGVTGNFKVPLMAALQEASSGAVTPKTAGKVLATSSAFMSHLASDKRVAACDHNPYGVAMSIQATLGPALTQLQSAFAAAARS